MGEQALAGYCRSCLDGAGCDASGSGDCESVWRLLVEAIARSATTKPTEWWWRRDVGMAGWMARRRAVEDGWIGWEAGPASAAT